MRFYLKSLLKPYSYKTYICNPVWYHVDSSDMLFYCGWSELHHIIAVYQYRYAHHLWYALLQLYLLQILRFT